MKVDACFSPASQNLGLLVFSSLHARALLLTSRLDQDILTRLPLMSAFPPSLVVGQDQSDFSTRSSPVIPQVIVAQPKSLGS